LHNQVLLGFSYDESLAVLFESRHQGHSETAFNCRLLEIGIIIFFFVNLYLSFDLRVKMPFQRHQSFCNQRLFHAAIIQCNRQKFLIQF
jgi:hypothetical protein